MTLHECASAATIIPYISQTDQNEVDDIFASQEVKADDNNSASDQPQQLYPISELFVALLHSTT